MVEMAVYDFLANMKGGGARPNLFRVVMAFPLFAQATGEESKTLSFLCKGAQLPESVVGQIEVPFRGRQVKIPGDRVFAEWTITVINDTDFQIKKAFERWSNEINQHRENLGPNNPQEIMSNARIDHLDNKGVIIASYEMVGIWPSEVGAIEMSYESTDEIEEFPVILQYQFWESDTTT